MRNATPLRAMAENTGNYQLLTIDYNVGFYFLPFTPHFAPPRPAAEADSVPAYSVGWVREGLEWALAWLELVPVSARSAPAMAAVPVESALRAEFSAGSLAPLS